MTIQEPYLGKEWIIVSESPVCYVCQSVQKEHMGTLDWPAKCCLIQEFPGSFLVAQVSSMTFFTDSYTWINVWKTLSAKACMGNHASSLLYPAILPEILSWYLLFSGVQFHEQDRKLQWTQQEACSNSKTCLCIDISWDISYWLSVANNRHVRISWVWVWPDSGDFQNLSGVQEYVAEAE